MQSQRDEQGQAGDGEQTEEQQSSAEEERIEAKIDRDLLDSFPASDPPGWTMGIRKRLPETDEAEGDASGSTADDGENDPSGR